MAHCENTTVRMAESADRLLVRVFLADQHANSAQQYPDVQADGPVLDVVEVVLDALYYFFAGIGLAPPTVNLSPTRKTWLDPIPHEIVGYDVRVKFPSGLSLGCVRPWPDQRHITNQNVNELWKFVEAGPS